MIINNIEYEINKGKRKNIYLQIKNGKVIVKVPYYVTNKQIEEIVYKKSNWIQKSLEKYNQKNNELKKYQEGEIYKILGKEYILKINYEETIQIKVDITDCNIIINLPSTYKMAPNLSNKIEKIINKMYMQIIQKQLDYTMKKVTNMVGLVPKKYRVRDMKSAWGSCSSTKNISIALKLIEHSPKAFEYVVLHEVCHLKHMNHSKQFWQMVEGYMPDYKKYKKELNSSNYNR
ncbi:MAG TPA: M48 family metallopeptidase [Clostridiaceae bacterium]|nr:M48 family metallopeptidase [Clostridiaceae bacterium]